MSASSDSSLCKCEYLQVSLLLLDRELSTFLSCGQNKMRFQGCNHTKKLIYKIIGSSANESIH